MIRSDPEQLASLLASSVSDDVTSGGGLVSNKTVRLADELRMAIARLHARRAATEEQEVRDRGQ